MRLVAWALLLSLVPLAARAQTEQVPPAILGVTLEQPSAEPLRVEASIVDESPILEPAFYWKPSGTTEPFHRVPLAAAEEGLFRARVPIPEATAAIDYYVEAFDAQGNGPASYGTREAPLQAAVQPSERTPEPSAGLSRAWIVAGALVLVGIVVGGIVLGVQAHPSPAAP